jgi:hypothetical protein
MMNREVRLGDRQASFLRTRVKIDQSFVLDWEEPGKPNVDLLYMADYHYMADMGGKAKD